MVRVLTVSDIAQLVEQLGIDALLAQLLEQLREDFANWASFDKTPRPAAHVPGGVIELMPTCSDELYAFKLVNGHPDNPVKHNKLTIIGTGMLADIETGYPILVSEMTLLTAFRTAATTAMATQCLARGDSRVLALIGNGAQAEFQAIAMQASCGIETIRYYDIDPAAMKKFASHMAERELNLIACDSAKHAVQGADVITTCTADKKMATILENEWIVPGQHINGLGGDCPGKTECERELVERAKVYVEYLPQTKIEGEIQQLDDPAVTELHDVINGKAPGREDASQITLFDSVGFAVEDYSVLKLVYRLAEQFNLGREMEMIPAVDNPKDIYGRIV